MNTQITTLVEQAVLERMRRKASFTALDISNALKADRYPVRHGEIARTVRDVFQSGAMAFYDYDRRLITVVTEGGSRRAQAFLYLHREAREREYTARAQEALPPVPPDQARDLTGCAAAPPSPILPRPRPAPARCAVRNRQRRDGALAIPRSLIRGLGCIAGDLLTVIAAPGKVTLTPDGEGGAGPTVRVWGGQRVRLCKTKLRLGLISAQRVTMDLEDGGLAITAGAQDGDASCGPALSAPPDAP